MRKETGKMLKNFTTLMTMLMLLLPVVGIGGAEVGNPLGRADKTAEGWSEDIQLTNFTSSPLTDDHAYRPVIASTDSFVYVVFEENWLIEPPYQGNELKFLRSDNHGKSWIFTNITDYDGKWSYFPSIAVNNSNIYLVWQDLRGNWKPEIYFKYSNDSGMSWSNDTALTSNDGVPSQKPHIVIWNNTLHVVWEDCRDDPYKAAGEIYYMRSLDGGITWDDGQGNVNQTQRLTFSGIETSSGCCEPTDIAVYGNTIHVVGTQIRPGNERAVVYLNSSDNGHSWSNVTYLSPINDGYNSACGSLAVRNNTVYAAFSDDYYGVVYRKCNITNNTWSDIVSVHPGAMTDVQITADYNSERLFITFWSSSMSYYTVSYDNGYFWYGTYNLSEEQAYSPQLAVCDDYVHAVFISDRIGNNEIYYKRYPRFNDPPAINYFYPLENLTITENQNITFTINVTDPDNDTLSYKWYLNNTLVSENTTAYTFTANSTCSGIFEIKVIISDNISLPVNHSWTITVVNVGELYNTISDLQDQLNQLNLTISELNETIGNLNQTLMLIWIELNQSLQNYSDLQNQTLSLLNTLSEIWNLLNQSKVNETELQNIINELNQNLNTSNKQISILWDLLNQSKSNETNLQNLLNISKQNETSLLNQINKLEQENKQLRNELNETKKTPWIGVIETVIILVGICIIVLAYSRKKGGRKHGK